MTRLSLDGRVRPVRLVGLLVLVGLCVWFRFFLDHLGLLLGGLLGGLFGGSSGGRCGGDGGGGVVFALFGLVDVVEARLLFVEAVAVLG